MRSTKPTRRQQDLLDLLKDGPKTPEELLCALYPHRRGRAEHGGALKGLYTLLTNLERQCRAVWCQETGKWSRVDLDGVPMTRERRDEIEEYFSTSRERLNAIDLL